MAEHQVMSWLPMHHSYKRDLVSHPNACLQLRRAISIQAEGTRLLEKYAIAPSAARLCSASCDVKKAATDDRPRFDKCRNLIPHLGG